MTDQPPDLNINADPDIDETIAYGESEETPIIGLSPMYAPATEDSFFIFPFIGNTAAPGTIQFSNCTPFQLYAAAAFLERHADRMLAAAENHMMQAAAQEAVEVERRKSQILTPAHIRREGLG